MRSGHVSEAPGQARPSMEMPMKRTDAVRLYRDVLEQAGVDSDVPPHLRDTTEEPDPENMSPEDLTTALQGEGLLVSDVVRDDDDPEEQDDED